MTAQLTVTPSTRAPAHRPWQETLPGRLRIRQGLIVFMAVLVALTGLFADRFFKHVDQTVGRDAAPSIVSAQKIRTALADAHTQLLNSFVGQQGEGGTTMRSYQQSMAQARQHLVLASENITYEEEERQPILAVLTQLSAYERLVGKAFAVKSDLAPLVDADTLMREQILPSALMLDQANFKHLNVVYDEETGQARHWLVAFGVAVLALCGLLAESQWLLYRQFRRLINPGLAAASLVVVAAGAAVLLTASHTMEDLRAAKEDAFDSVHALAQSEAVAYAAQADQSVYLLLHGRDAQAGHIQLFEAASAQVYKGRLQSAAALRQDDLKAFKGQGFLGDELANITYPGERALALAELDRWMAYVTIDNQLRGLESSGRHEDAVALSLGTDAGQSGAAFQAFIAALTQTMQLNQHEFDDAVARADHHLARIDKLLLLLLLAPLAGAFVGFRARLAEFRA